MKKHWRAILIAGILILVGLGVVVIVRGNSAQGQSQSLQTFTVARGTLSTSIGATGSIQARQQASMEFPISGQVGTVDIQLGDRVNSGQTLVELDPAYYPQQVISAQADLINAQKTLDNLKTSQTALAQAELDLANAKKTLDDAQTDYDTAFITYNVGWLQQTRDLADQAYSDWEDYRFHNDGSFKAMIELQRRWRAYQDALQEVKKAQRYHDAGVGTSGGTAEAKKQLDIATGKLDLAQAQYDDALAAYNRLKDGVPAQDLQTAQAQVDSAQAILNQVKIQAPFSGTILAVNVVQGDMVGPGNVVVVIADLSELHVDVPIAEVDYNRLAAGQSAQLVLDAIPATTYHGKVSQIGLNASTASGSVSYPIRVVVSDPDQNMLPGMTVAVEIEVSHLDNVLLVPNRAVRNVGGSLVVYVLRNGVQKPVAVELGITGDTLSQVTKGDLQEGDIVVLNPSASTSGGG
jgi:HlyD family secretion protein